MESLIVRKSLQPNDVYEQVTLFWARAHSQLLARLSFNAVREVALYLRSCAFLVSISHTTLSIHRLPSFLPSVHPISQSFTRSIVLLLNETEVICIGSFPGSSDLYSIDLVSFQVTQLRPMTESRYRPGAIKFDRFVYIFGGFRRGTQFYLNSSEKVDIFQRVCQPLPQMRTNRAAFTPVCFQRSVLLPDFLMSEHGVDVFHPDSDTFTVVPTAVPLLQFGGVYVLESGELIHFRHDHKLSLNILARTWKTSRIRVNMNSSGSLSEVKVVGRTVVWVNCSGEVLKFDLRTGDFHRGCRQVKRYEYEHDFLEHSLPPYT